MASLAGTYNFSVKELNSKLVIPVFEIFDFDRENNLSIRLKLKQLATQTQGSSLLS
jgi:hypothetical protein